MRLKITLSLLLFVFFSTFYASAEQTFIKKKHADSVSFHYEWLDYSHQQQRLDFSLNKQVIFNEFRNFKSYKPLLAEAFIQHSLKQKLTKNPITGINISFKKLQGKYKVKLTGKDQQKLALAEQQINTLEQQYFTQYLENNNYQQFVMPNNIQGIKPNHIKFAEQSVEPLKVIKPLILKSLPSKNIRNATNYVLNFVQNIPYAPLILG